MNGSECVLTVCDEVPSLVQPDVGRCELRDGTHLRVYLGSDGESLYVRRRWSRARKLTRWYRVGFAVAPGM